MLLNKVLQFWKGTFRITGEGSVVLNLIYGNRKVARAIGLEKKKNNKNGFLWPNADPKTDLSWETGSYLQRSAWRRKFSVTTRC